jgi:thiamine biosynthesis lipoprotein
MIRFLFILSTALLISSSCIKEELNQQEKTSLFAGDIMEVPYKIILGQKIDRKEKHEVHRLIQKTFEDVNTTYNGWNPDSEISKLNKMPKGTTAISPELEDLLRAAGDAVRISSGRFDPSVDPLVQLWKTKLSAGEKPSDQELRATSNVIGWDKIHLENGYFSKSHDNTSLNLDGMSKGLCVDMLTERLKAAGYKSLYVEWGGEIRCTGEHPDQRPWTIFVSNLGDPNPQHAIATIPLQDSAIASSGDYLQQWNVKESNKKSTYTHIIDPKTKQALEVNEKRIASVTVLAPTCAIADALATAAMLFDTIEEARTWAKEVQATHPNTAFWFITRGQDSNSTVSLPDIEPADKAAY